MERERLRHCTISNPGPPHAGAKRRIQSISVPGFKIFTDRHGKPRCYHRRSRIPVNLKKFPLDTPGFIEECNRIASAARSNTKKFRLQDVIPELIERHRQFFLQYGWRG